ncbi:hypothetical protein L486_07322 [Kwoniella mangroviensis CBS 10435]|uniref:Uncharacterized protein n=1 Tax=Kwoniella mangroviensis CBS 10435 TaxID=1331196 RepID=A0A1B9IHP1_9TREE|nr:hypothetical protein L486_07322 [Kwoniella mangroviensis CBS 10435]
MAGSSSSLNQLPDDVLLRIITFLRNMRPALDPRREERGRQRPNMLLILMRVSARLHNLIVPYIYTSSVIIDAPATFFYGISLSPPMSCMTKRDRLRLIKCITFSFPFKVSSEDIDWEDIIFYPQAEMVLKRYIHALEQVERSLTALRDLNVDGVSKLMANVERLSIMPMQEWQYEKHHSLINPKIAKWGIKECWNERVNYLLDNRFRIQDEFKEMIPEIMNPRHVCNHSPLGPYSYPLNLSSEPTSIPITYSTDIGREYIRYKLPIPILPRSTTRLIIQEETIKHFKPKEDWFLTQQDIDIISFQAFIKWFRASLTRAIQAVSYGGRDNDMTGQTRVVIHVPTSLAILKVVVGRLRTSVEAHADTMEKDGIYEELGKWMIGKKRSGFKSRGIKVDMVTWDEKGRCPACDG